MYTPGIFLRSLFRNIHYISQKYQYVHNISHLFDILLPSSNKTHFISERKHLMNSDAPYSPTPTQVITNKQTIYTI